METNNTNGFESLSIHLERQEVNYTEERVIKWLQENYFGESRIDFIKECVLCMNKQRESYQVLVC